MCIQLQNNQFTCEQLQRYGQRQSVDDPRQLNDGERPEPAEPPMQEQSTRLLHDERQPADVQRHVDVGRKVAPVAFLIR